MKLVVIVLNKTECLEDLLEEFSHRKIQGATIINSKGMMQELMDYNSEDVPIIGSIRKYLNPDHKQNYTIFMAAYKEAVPDIIDAVNKVTGGIDKGDTGILFTLTIDQLLGFKIKEGTEAPEE